MLDHDELALWAEFDRREREALRRALESAKTSKSAELAGPLVALQFSLL